MNSGHAHTFGNFAEPASGHFERPISSVVPKLALLYCPDNAVAVIAVAFEVEHGINHVFEQAWAGEVAFFGDVANEQHRNATEFGEIHKLVQQRRSCVTLPGAAGADHS